jgi:hypothetical protein
LHWSDSSKRWEECREARLAFFISDGFLADSGPRGRVSRDRLSRITDSARQSAVVVYTIDAKGLVSGALDATGETPFDPDGRLESAQLRAIAASQDPLNALAADTGGRALRNQNRFDIFVNDALDERSRFYLIAWVPETENASNEKTEERRNKSRSDIPSSWFSPLTAIPGEKLPQQIRRGQREGRAGGRTENALSDAVTASGLPCLSHSFISTRPPTGPCSLPQSKFRRMRWVYGDNRNERRTSQ